MPGIATSSLPTMLINWLGCQSKHSKGEDKYEAADISVHDGCEAADISAHVGCKTADISAHVCCEAADISNLVGCEVAEISAYVGCEPADISAYVVCEATDISAHVGCDAAEIYDHVGCKDGGCRLSEGLGFWKLDLNWPDKIPPGQRTCDSIIKLKDQDGLDDKLPLQRWLPLSQIPIW
jgi:hypothetical protein